MVDISWSVGNPQQQNPRREKYSLQVQFKFVEKHAFVCSRERKRELPKLFVIFDELHDSQFPLYIPH